MVRGSFNRINKNLIWKNKFPSTGFFMVVVVMIVVMIVMMVVVVMIVVMILIVTFKM